MDKDNFFSRSEMIFGTQKLNNLKNSHVLVLGLGGVGGYVAEILVRSGIGEMTIVDGDFIAQSNLNRQIIALTSNINMPKSDAFKKRLLEINPNCIIHSIVDFIEGEKIDKLLETNFDYAVDAIDSLDAKCTFLSRCLDKKIPVISAMGAARKLNPAKVAVADISKTNGCPLARVVRKKLKSLGITKGIKTVFSNETLTEKSLELLEEKSGQKKVINGSCAHIVAIFGATIASEVIADL